MLRFFTKTSFCLSRRFLSAETSFSESFPDLSRPTTSSRALQESLSVLVVHPKVRWGSGSGSVLKQPERQLEEAVSLVNTLHHMHVVDSLVLPVDYNTKRKAVWAGGNIARLVEMQQSVRATALMINVDMLTPMQQEELHRIFGVPIYDRYNIVLSIFKEYAQTEVARLQIALAELPYIKSRLHVVNAKKKKAKPVFHVDSTIFDRNVEDLHEALRKREQALRRQLKEAIVRSEESCVNAAKEASVVAVVGYTNAGKTSLVKRLTGAESLHPKDRLFATLDTTRHFAKLPSGRPVVFTDTIGFLSDLPINLIAAFEATLAHVIHADVIIHLRDVSNLDWRAQDEDVIGTLKAIGINEKRLIDNVITVDNKTDREGAANAEATGNDVRISCATGDGVQKLIEIVDKNVIRATGCKKIRLRLDVSSPAIEFLYRQGLVSSEPIVEDNVLIFDVVFSAADFAIFRSKFSNLKKS